MTKKEQNDIHPTIFEKKEIRRVWHEEQWFFVIEDIVQVLVESKNIKDYINKMRKRDPELNKGYEQIVHTLDIATKGGKQKMNCGSLQGIFRIIQSIPSPKAEPFKQWLARVGQERIEEIQDPEREIVRAKKIYEHKGYNADWIAKRMRGINIRNTLTEEWQERGAKEGFDFAILTNEIYRGTFKMDAKQIKEFKSLSNPDNPRDHMSELELILTMLGEATTTEITTTRDSKGLPELSQDAKEGGAVAGRTRRDIERKTGKSILLRDNFKNKKLLKDKIKK